MKKHCPACGRSLSASDFPTPRAKNCVECAAVPKRKRRPIPAEWREKCRVAEAETGAPHVVDHIIPWASRSRPTHKIVSVLICGLDIPENWAVVTVEKNRDKSWYFSEADARTEEERIMAHCRAIGLAR